MGLFCETIRVFLLAVSREHPGLGEGNWDGLAQRYLKETGEASRYEDARSGEGRRRLSVCARDVYRLVHRFRGTAVAQMDEYGLLERLLREQCHVGRHGDGRPGAMMTMRVRGRCDSAEGAEGGCGRTRCRHRTTRGDLQRTQGGRDTRCRWPRRVKATTPFR